MTTEVLRNMLYADSPALHGLSYVVMDEVHFLADRMRGAVWEEVILHLPEEVRLVSLSATVSNAEEFGGWIQTVRGDTTVVVDEHRPVPLWQHMLVGKRLFDLFDYRAGRRRPRTAASCWSTRSCCATSRIAGRPTGWPTGSRAAAGRGHRGRPTHLPAAVAARRDRDARPRGAAARDHVHLLPGRLRRRGQAVPAVVAAADHRRGPRRDRRDHRPPLRRPGRRRPRSCSATTNGGRGCCAAWPPTTPACCRSSGTPSRSCSPQAWSRPCSPPRHWLWASTCRPAPWCWSGWSSSTASSTPQLTPGEYTQLTGRAGRRGIDVEGHAVVLWSPDVEPAEVAGLASTRTFPLRSSFAPSYNMTINLVNQMGPEQAHQLLERSFAQYQADRSVVGLVRGVERGERMLDEIAAELGGVELGPRPDRAGDPRLRAAAREDHRTGTRPVAGVAAAAPQRGQRRAVRAAPRRHHQHHQRPPRRPGRGARTGPRRRRPAPAGADRKPLGRTDFVGRLLRSVGAAGLDDVAQAGRAPPAAGAPRPGVGAAVGGGRSGDPAGKPARRLAQERDIDPELAALREQLRDHPAHRLADREATVRLAERYLRIERDNAQIRQKVAAATNSLARTFDRIVVLLTERGFIEGAAGRSAATRGVGAAGRSAAIRGRESRGTAPRVTNDGRLLARIYSESDLLVAECLRRARGRDCSRPSWPRCCRRCSSSRVATRRAHRWAALRFPPRRCAVRWPRPAGWLPSCAPTSSGTGSRSAASPTRASYRRSTAGPPPATWRPHWPHRTRAGAGSPLSAGDFVRWCRQVLDLLDQVRNAARRRRRCEPRRNAPSTTIRRGVVAVDAGRCVCAAVSDDSADSRRDDERTAGI